MLSNKKSLLVAIATLSLSGAAYAEGLYGTALVGKGFAPADQEAYGNNIAVDADFPGAFDTDESDVAALGVGYDFGNQFRVEGRVGFRKAEFNDRKIGTGARDGEEYILNGQLESTTFTVEGFYDFPVTSSFDVYAKAGLGVSDNDYEARLGGAGVAGFDAFDGAVDGYYDAYADGSSTEFTWNAGFGGSYAINDRFALVGEYQYIDLGSAETGQDSFTDGFETDATANEVLVGLRVNF